MRSSPWLPALIGLVSLLPMILGRSARSGEPGIQAYQLTILPGTGGISNANALYTDEPNGRYWVAGSFAAADGKTHAAVWDGGTLIDLGLLGGGTAAAYGVAPDLAGNILASGTSTIDEDSNVRGFTWSGGQLTEIGPNPSNLTTRAYASGGGTLVLGSLFTVGGQLNGALWDDGGLTTLAGLSPAAAAEVTAGSSVVQVGYSSTAQSVRHACMWDAGGPVDLGSLDGAAGRSIANGVNAFGLTPLQVVGEGQVANGETHAFFWQGGQMTDLNPAGSTNSRAFGIDALGNVVGRSGGLAPGLRAAMWTAGTPTDLNSRLLANPTGAVLVEARAIDNRGYIAGNCSVGGGTRAFILSPIYSDSPLIEAAVPNQARPGATLTVSLNGHRFVSPATADFGRDITVNSTQVLRDARGAGGRPLLEHILRCNITISPEATPGKRTVRVTNPGGAASSVVGLFEVLPPQTTPTLIGFTLTPTKVKGGNKVKGNVTLSGPAGPGGVLITFTSSAAGLPPPPDVTVPEGQSTLPSKFNYKTKKVRRNTSYTVSAVLGVDTLPVKLKLTK